MVLTRDEVKAVLSGLDGDRWLMASLMFGSRFRLLECLRLRVLDIEFARGEIVVRDGRGGKDSVTMLPRTLTTAAIVEHASCHTPRHSFATHLPVIWHGSERVVRCRLFWSPSDFGGSVIHGKGQSVFGILRRLQDPC